MKYFSLNKECPEVSFREAVFRGIAPDRGLYFPVHIPGFAPGFLESDSELDPVEIGLACMRPYVGGEISPTRLESILQQVLEFPFPVVRLSEQIATLELFHGPTLAFKDVGARFMARCLGAFTESESKSLTVLVATSGDTGGAVADGFLGVDGVEVVILYPRGKVSDIQQRQLTTHGQNITALEVEGTFDDCQDMVKTAFVDEDFKGRRRFTSANSINVARWLPQMIYFVLACRILRGNSRPLVYAVPSGNFGNICAGMMAWKMGMPAAHFIAATNANDTIARYMETGAYQPRATRPTLSNAMDVSDPSNFIRIRQLFHSDRFELSRMFSCRSFSDNKTRKALSDLYRRYSYTADPHGAVGYLALKDYLRERPEAFGLFLETAHPIKFRETVEQSIGQELPLPDSIAKLMQKPGRSIPVRNYEEVKAYLLSP